jgi:hypothetical protein
MRMAPNTKGAMSACCTLANPFAASCKGCKLPDGMNGRSLPFQIRGISNYIVDSGGYYFLEIAPFMPYGILTAASRATAVWTLASTWAEYNVPSIFTTYAGLYRIVCAGVKITVVSSVPNTSGTMILSTLDNFINPSNTYTSGTMDAQDVVVVPLATGAEYVWLAKPTGPRIFLNQSTSSATEVVAGPPFTSLIVDISGGVASLTSISVEYVFNLEMQFTAGSGGLSAGLGHLTPPDPPANTPLIDRVQHTQRVMPHVVKGGVEAISKAVESSAATVFSKLAIKGTDFITSSLEGMLAAL